VVDFVLLEEVAHHDQLQEQTLTVLPLMLVGPADSGLPAGKAVAFSEAIKLPLLLPSHHLGLRAVLNDAALWAHLHLNLRLEADSARLMRDLLLRGMGYTILPACYCQEEIASGRLQAWPITDPALSIDIVVASRKNSQLTGPRIRAIEELISQTARELLGQT
jgi:LysR family transcriptional regulator, nitrogen assimilation regulatory protein